MGPTALLLLRRKSYYEFLSPLKTHRSRVVAGIKNSPTVNHACRKRRLKWVPSAWGIAGSPCLRESKIRRLGPPGWGLGAGLTIQPCKKVIVTELQKWRPGPVLGCRAIWWWLKIHRPRPGLNPLTLGPLASTIITRPPRSTGRLLFASCICKVRTRYALGLSRVWSLREVTDRLP
jgi:hypothetical protein